MPLIPEVYRLARQMSDEHRAQDLVQETYLRAWKYFASFEPGSNCRAWLFHILHNVWRDQWRRLRLEVPLSEEAEAAIEPYYDWEDDFISDEPSPEFATALSQVPDVYRWAILLADVEELSYQEIAQVMNCPIGTVMSRVNRGRRTLARLIRARSAAEGTETSKVEPVSTRRIKNGL
jgi:RNA polymerase sigma-70 factor (ECF subfamily)